ncbi:class I SAM-dependent methyltransferase [Phenylobacterium sp.]|uniref:class I SAM-dependent methyltransferase n=1 Tax=Phenylobacterium sp. TaxID=1871053 RepID=UPI00392FAD87
MRPEEAAWIGDVLARLGPERISPLLELGSSTLEFRTVEKPHIEALIHRPLRDRGVRVVHADLKGGPGIDISGDIYDPAVREAVKAVGARSILCCNILEHLADREAFIRTCDEVLSPGGVLLLTVPRSYPLHLDPIDTYYRPTPEALAALLPDYALVETRVIRSGSHLSDLRERGSALREVLATFWRSLILRGGPAGTRARLHRLAWLFRPYLISAVVPRKPGPQP